MRLLFYPGYEDVTNVVCMGESMWVAFFRFGFLFCFLVAGSWTRDNRSRVIFVCVGVGREYENNYLNFSLRNPPPTLFVCVRYLFIGGNFFCYF